MTINENKKFAWFLEKFGNPTCLEAASLEIIEKFRGKIPDILIKCWEHYGFCSFKDGLFFIVNPEDYNSTLISWLNDTGLLEIDKFHIFARSGFGELFVWGERTGQHFNIETIENSIFDNGSDENYLKKAGPSEAILNFFTVLKTSTLDIDDIHTDKPIFKQAIDKFGPLRHDEMFTFEPAIFLGGEKTLQSVNKVNFFMQSEILEAMGHREIMDMNSLAKKVFNNKP